MDILHSALEYLPKLWMRSCCFEEAIIAYRRALAKPWNLDSERSANLQKDLAVTLLYCGVEVPCWSEREPVNPWEQHRGSNLIITRTNKKAIPSRNKMGS